MKTCRPFSRQISFRIVLHFFLSTLALAQSRSLTGRVVDATTRQPIDHASVVILTTGFAASTDTAGFFHFVHINSDSPTLRIRHLGFADIERRVQLDVINGDTLEIEMQSMIFQSREIVIQSVRIPSVLLHTPFASDVKTAQELIKRPNVTVSDALSEAPGVSLVRDGAWATAVSLRGMSRSNIITLIDDTRIETAHDIAGALSLVNINDLERIETIKSSGSTLYGTGALGGIVHLITKRPEFSDDFRMAGEFSSAASSVDNGFSKYLAFEGSSEIYSARISGGHRIAGNTKTPEGILPNSQFRDYSLLADMRLKTFDEQTLRFSYQRSQAENAGIPGGAPIALSASAEYTLARRELIGLEYRMPNISPTVLQLAFRFSRQEITRNVEISQSPTLALTPHATHLTLSAQTEAVFHFPTEHLLIVGIEIWQRELDSQRERIEKNRNQITGERPVPLSKHFNCGVFAQGDWKLFTNRLTFTYGARYDWVRITNEQALNPEYVIASGVKNISPTNQRTIWQSGVARNGSWSANAGMLYSLTSNFDVGLLAATAFRSPSLEERYQYIDLGNVVRLGNPNLKPEKSVTANITLRFQSEKLKLESDVFVNGLNDLVAELPGTYEARPAYIKTNIGEARIYGFEISGESSLANWNSLHVSLSYVRGEDTRNHTNLPQIAPLSARVDFSGIARGIGTLRVGCVGVSDQNHVAAGELRTPGYTTFDFGYVSEQFNWGGIHLMIRSGVQNMFDKAYRNHLSTLRGLVKSEPARNYYLSATVSI